MKTLGGKKVLILGLTFKPETSDVRGSLGNKIAEFLQSEGAQVIAHDP
jgi:UDPglucose 6-dehydrogenase